MSVTGSQRKIGSPKASFKQRASLPENTTGAAESFTSKPNSRAVQRVTRNKNDGKLRVSQLANQQDTSNFSYNQYGIMDGASSTLNNVALL